MTICRAARRGLLLAALGALLSGCAGWFAPPPGIGREVALAELPGWSDDHQAAAWPALLKGCATLATRDAVWDETCRAARALDAPDDAQARAFFERYFRAFRVNGDGTRDGLVTGYYEPVLNGSPVRTARFRYPLYRRPDDLLIVDLAGLYPELRGKTVRGRLLGNRVVPYLSRNEIDAGTLAGNELLWVDDPVELYLLQVQGSGRVRLPDGSETAVGYADQNGYPYRSLGARLIELGALTREQVTLASIRAWLAAHPDETEALLGSNPSYVFFTQRPAAADGPLGSLGVPLTPERSVAVDPAFVPLGLPVWLDTTLPCAPTDACAAAPYRRLVFAQDTGGAIKGAVRADLFLGRGAEAGRVAGEMKQRGQLYVLRPNPPQPATAVTRR